MKDSFNGATLHQDRDGAVIRVIDCDQMNDEEREAYIALLKARLGIVEN